MLRAEWGKLEVVSARIDELYQRHSAAEKMGNSKRVRDLAAEISIAQRQRTRLLEHITARVSDAA